MRKLRAQRGRQARRIVRERPGFRIRPGDDAGAIERERAVRIREQRDGGIGGYVPGDGVGRQPVRLRLGEVAVDAADDDAQLLGHGVPLEHHVHAVGRHRERDVRPVLHATLAVVHVPAAVERHLGLIGAGRNGAGAEAVDRRVVDVLQPGAEAAGIPVAGAAHLALEVAGHGGDDGADVLGDPVGLVVVVERDALRRGGRRERDVRAVLLGVQAVVHVPAAVERHLVFVCAGRRDAEGVAPDVAVRVVHQLGGGAARIPVAGATGFRLIVARDSDRSRRSGPMRPRRGRPGRRMRATECARERACCAMTCCFPRLIAPHPAGLCGSRR